MAVSQVFTTTGSQTWNWPAGVTSVTAEALGGGGGSGTASGNPATGGGGKGGSYATAVITKGAESLLTIVVGTGGALAGAGAASTVVQSGTTRVSAAGGSGGATQATSSANGAGGTALNGANTGTTTFAGGNGGTGNFTSGTQGSGAGGGAAGPTSVGGAASVNTAGTAGTGTWANGSAYQAAGRAGVGNSLPGVAGVAYGGAASGGKASTGADQNGAVGFQGIVLLTWIPPDQAVTNVHIAPTLVVRVPTVAQNITTATRASTAVVNVPTVSAPELPALAVTTGTIGAGDLHYSTPFTVQSGTITGTLTNYPAYVNQTLARFKSVANGGHVASAQGYDLIPYADAGCTTRLDFDRLFYDPATGQVEDFVRLPSAAVGSTIYYGYGDPSITTDQSTPTAVWSNAGASGVWHFVKNGVLTGNDATANANHGTFTGVTASSGGALFNGTSSKLTIPDSATLKPTSGPWSITGVIRNVASQSAPCAIFASYNQQGGGIVEGVDVGIDVYTTQAHKLSIVTGNTGYCGYAGTTVVDDANPHWFVIASDGTVIRIYVDGGADEASRTTGGGYVVPSYHSPNYIRIGCEASDVNAGDAKFLPGILDEIQVFNGTALTQAWAAATYANQSNQAAFFGATQSEVTLGSAAGVSVFAPSVAHYQIPSVIRPRTVVRPVLVGGWRQRAWRRRVVHRYVLYVAPAPDLTQYVQFPSIASGATAYAPSNVAVAAALLSREAPTSAGTHYLRYDGVDVLDGEEPRTISIWLRVNAAQSFSLDFFTSEAEWRYWLGTLIPGSNVTYGTTENYGGGGNNGYAEYAGPDFPRGSWFNVLLEFAGPTSRRIYVNNVAGSENTDEVIGAASDGDTFIRFGITGGGANGGPFRFADVAVWRRVLTSTERARLQSYYADSVPGAEVYWSLRGSLVDAVHGWTLVDAGSGAATTFSTDGPPLTVAPPDQAVTGVTIGSTATLGPPLIGTYLSREWGAGPDEDWLTYVASDILAGAVEPLTMACWLWIPSGTGSITPVKIYGSGGAYWAVNPYTGFKTFVFATNGTASALAQSTGAPPVDGWYHVIAEFVSSTLRRVYVNNVAGADETTSVSMTGVTVPHIDVGHMDGNVVGTQMRIADVAIWTRTLTSGERALLQSYYADAVPGAHRYWSLRGTLTDEVVGAVLVPHPSSIGASVFSPDGPPLSPFPATQTIVGGTIHGALETGDDVLGDDGYILLEGGTDHLLLDGSYAGTAVLFAPTVTGVGGGAQSVTSGTVAPTAVLNAPTVVPQAVALTAGTVAATSIARAPTTIAPQAVTITTSPAGGSLLVYAPITVAPGPVAVTTGTRASTLQVFAPPTLTVGPVAVSTPGRATTAQVFAPALTAVSTGATIPPTSGAFAPSVAAAVSLATIAPTSAALAMTVQAVVTLPHRASTLAVNAPPTVAVGPATVLLPTISATTTLLEPLISTGGTAVVLPLWAPSTQLFAATVTTGAVPVSTGTVAATSQVFAPTVAPGAALVTGGTVATTAQLFQPAVAWLTLGATIPPGSGLFPPATTSTLTAGTVPSGSALVGPTVSLAGQTAVLLTSIPSTTVLSGATVTTGPVSVALATIASVAVLFVLTVAQPAAQAIGGPTAASAVAMQPPTVATGPVAVAGRVAPATAVLFPPTALVEGGLGTPPLPATTQLFALTVTPQAVTLTGGTVGSTSATTAPSLAGTVVLATRPGASAATPPAVATGPVTVLTPQILTGVQTFPPTVLVGAVTVVGPHVPPSATLFPVTVGVRLDQPTVPSTAQLFAPSVATGAVTVALVPIPVGSQAFAPDALVPVASGATIGSTAALYTPTLTGQVTTPAWVTGTILFPPSALPLGEMILAFIPGGSAAHAPFMVAYAPPPEILDVTSNLVRQTTGTVTLCRAASGTTVLTRAVSLTTTVARVHAASGSLIRRSFTVEVER